ENPREGRVVAVYERLVAVGCTAVLVDRLDRADRLAGAAVDALLGVDVALADPFVDAVDRALVDARLVVDVDAGAGDDVRHVVAPSQPCELPASRRRTLNRCSLPVAVLGSSS